jgi:hypothetical protein
VPVRLLLLQKSEPVPVRLSGTFLWAGRYTVATGRYKFISWQPEELSLQISWFTTMVEAGEEAKRILVPVKVEDCLVWHFSGDISAWATVMRASVSLLTCLCLLAQHRGGILGYSGLNNRCGILGYSGLSNICGIFGHLGLTTCILVYWGISV